MKTRPKQRKSASNQSAVIKGYFKSKPTANDFRRQSIQDILAKIKK